MKIIKILPIMMALIRGSLYQDQIDNSVYEDWAKEQGDDVLYANQPFYSPEKTPASSLGSENWSPALFYKSDTRTPSNPTPAPTPSLTPFPH